MTAHRGQTREYYCHGRRQSQRNITSKASQAENTDFVQRLSSVQGEMRWSTAMFAKSCRFEEKPKETHELKIEQLQKQVDELQTKLLQQGGQPGPVDKNVIAAAHSSSHADSSLPSTLNNPVTVETRDIHTASPASSRVTETHRSSNGSSIFAHGALSLFRAGRTTVPFHFLLSETLDVVDAGIITLDQAYSYFITFFEGCDRYVPVFDPEHDTLESVRSRSGLLFSVMCTVGCRALSGTDAQPWRILNFHTRRTLNAAIAVPSMLCLETIQALLVRACYASERSLLIAAATRMAVDLGLPGVYEDLMSQVLSISRGRGGTRPIDDVMLMQKTRTWLHILNMSHILHVDAGDVLAVRFAGDARRSRVLLTEPLIRKQDMCLWPQVELNALRAQMHERLSELNHTDAEIMDIVSDAMIDINVWFDDWRRIFNPNDPHTPWLALNMQVQRCWGVTMALCRAIRTTGVENVDIMSPTQKQMLTMAQDALRQHLDIITREPRIYLHNLRYAMDFVWAKCVFCYLLLLKLSILLPAESTPWENDLIERGNALLSELSEAGGGLLNGHRSNTGKIYLQLLETGIEKFSTAMNNDVRGHINDPGGDEGQGGTNNAGQNSFVPEQFVFEWDFPGLNLYSSSITETEWLDNILQEALSGTDEFMAFGWSSAEATD
ncbi:hypothetical protein QQS21_002580 [Conoideocrella luteorostrata]|uniref:Transcription factor domain-containing protein n=1 Tax=Conoideocrella luteorostrata TaxID=1105319 RepID=A0AAJ0FWE2_9HYPO|nr:hypothetical protein QQS21_002580 [Conoideocrella luteorostrata]